MNNKVWNILAIIGVLFLFFTIGRLKQDISRLEAAVVEAQGECNLKLMDTDTEEFGSDQIFIQQVFNCNGNMIAVNSLMSGNPEIGGGYILLDEVRYIGKIDPQKSTYHLNP